MSSVDVSVIIPIYNRGAAVAETIESCLAQPHVSVEVLAVDDASTDGTKDVLVSFGDRIRFVPLTESHGNGTFARNHGLRLARGEFVKFLDHDDVLEPDTLRAEVETARRESADLVMTGWGVCELDTSCGCRQGTERRYAPPACDRVIEAILGEAKTPFTAATLYRRELVADMEWDSAVALYDDFDWFSRAALRATKIARCRHIAYWWRLHDDSLQSQTARNPLSYFHAEKTRCLIYRKVEDSLVNSQRLNARRRDLLLAAYYRGLRAFRRWDPVFCDEIVGRIQHLRPGWCPPRNVETNAVFRAAIASVGLKTFLGIYGLLRGGGDR